MELSNYAIKVTYDKLANGWLAEQLLACEEVILDSDFNEGYKQCLLDLNNYLTNYKEM